MTQAAAIVTAAGIGARMGGDVPKQFRLLGGMPMLARTLRVFEESERVDRIILTVPEGYEAHARRAVTERYAFKKVTDIVAGGAHRQASVHKALCRLNGYGGAVVLIHDGARPLVTRALIGAVLEAALRFGAAAAALPVGDTVKLAGPDGFVARTVARDGLWLAQTPQGFSAPLIRSAHEAAIAAGYVGTDDAELAERFAQARVRLVPGEPRNIKITAPFDMAMAEAWLIRETEI